MQRVYPILTAVLLFFTLSGHAQLKEGYKKFSANISIPVLAQYHQKVINKSLKTTTENEEQKHISLPFYVSVDDLKVNGLFFSGKMITTNSVSTDIKTFHGELSEDRTTIKRIVFLREYKVYSVADRAKAYVEEEVHFTLELKNLELKYFTYKFNPEVSSIAQISYHQIKKRKYNMDLVIETTTEQANQVDKEAYGPSISINYSVGRERKEYEKEPVVDAKIRLRLENEEDRKVTEYKITSNGIYSLIVHDLTKVQGLKVLEGLKLQQLKEEIALSESGLVEENSRNENRLMEPDIEILMSFEDPVPDDPNLPLDQYLVRSKILLVASGLVIDPNLVLQITKGNRNTLKEMQLYAQQVVAFSKLYIYK